MTRIEIIEELKDIILKAMGEEDPSIFDNCSEESQLTTDLGMTSINILFSIIAIEERFNISFNEDGVEDFQTVGDVVNYIEREMNE